MLRQIVYDKNGVFLLVRSEFSFQFYCQIYSVLFHRICDKEQASYMMSTTILLTVLQVLSNRPSSCMFAWMSSWWGASWCGLFLWNTCAGIMLETSGLFGYQKKSSDTLRPSRTLMRQNMRKNGSGWKAKRNTIQASRSESEEHSAAT